MLHFKFQRPPGKGLSQLPSASSEKSPRVGLATLSPTAQSIKRENSTGCEIPKLSFMGMPIFPESSSSKPWEPPQRMIQKHYLEKELQEGGALFSNQVLAEGQTPQGLWRSSAGGAAWKRHRCL